MNKLLNKKFLVALLALISFFVFFPTHQSQAACSFNQINGGCSDTTAPDNPPDIIGGCDCTNAGSNLANTAPPPTGQDIKEAASSLFDIASTTVLRIFNTLLEGINYILGKFVGLIGGIMSSVLNYQDLVPDGSNPDHIVTLGWGNVLSVANMFFVIFLIIIAFATILGIERYNYRNILWKLIVAALLINFSLVIAGVFVDFSQVLTNFFLGKLDGKLINDTMSDSMAMQSLNTPPDATSISTWGTNQQTDLNFQLSFALSKFLNIFFLLINIVVFCAFIVMFVVRIIAIWVLLILSPMAWVMWIFPNTESIWHRWWSSFIKWVFFAPIATFFIWLSTTAVSNMMSGFGFDQAYSDAAASVQGFNQASNLSFIMQFVVATGLLVASLMVAQQMGITGASAAIGILQRSKSKITGYAKQGARYAGGKAAETAGRVTGATAVKERVSDYFASQKLIRQRETAERKEDRARRARGEEVPQESAYQRAKSGVKFEKMTQGLSGTEKLELAAKVSRGKGVEALEAKRRMAEADIETPQKAAEARKVATVMEGMEEKGVKGDVARARLVAERTQMAKEKREKEIIELHGKGSTEHKRFLDAQSKAADKLHGEAITEMEKTEKKGYTLVMPTGDIARGTGEKYKHYSDRDEELRKEALMTPEELQKKRESQMDLARKEMIADFNKRTAVQPEKEEIEWRGKKAGLTPQEINDQIAIQRDRNRQVSLESTRTTAEREKNTAKLMEQAAKDMAESGKQLKSLVETPEVLPPRPPISPVAKDSGVVVRPVQTVENPEELPPAPPKPPTV